MSGADRSPRGRRADLDVFVTERESLIALARSFVRSTAVAEELVQDSWLRWQRSQYCSAKARPIFRTIVANLARDWWRRERRERAVLDSLAPHAESAIATDRVVIARSDLARVLATLEALPPRTRTAFRLSWQDGLGYAEIGRRLGVSKARVHQLVHRALVELALSLDD
ncbi:MAG: RNA polymerase sigma factor [Pseudomonadota bacterium]